jgi:hypothetical protein
LIRLPAAKSGSPKGLGFPARAEILIINKFKEKLLRGKAGKITYFDLVISFMLGNFMGFK